MGILRNLAESFAMKWEFVKMGIFHEIRYNIKTKWDPTLAGKYCTELGYNRDKCRIQYTVIRQTYACHKPRLPRSETTLKKPMVNHDKVGNQIEKSIRKTRDRSRYENSENQISLRFF